MLYKDWLNIWLDNYVRAAAKSKTYEHYRYLSEAHIIPYIGKLNISEITAIELQQYVSSLTLNGNKITGRGLASNTVNTIISVLQSSLKAAQASGAAEHNPSERIKRPKKTEKRVECFSLAEQKQIEEHVLQHAKSKMFGVLLCLYTGLRIGELLALEWGDVDFEKGILFVNKSARDNKSGKGDKRIIDTPKTCTSARVIPLPKQLIPLFKKHLKNSDAPWIVSHNGNPVSTRSYQRSFELLLKNAGIEHKGFHALRHTFATRAIECGMDVKTLSEILGHKNPTITLNLYVHSLMEHKKEMMNRIGKNL